MAERLPSECTESGCRIRTTDASGYCDKHRTDNSRLRQRRAFDKDRYEHSPWRKWYQTTAWRNLRAWFWSQPESVICAAVENGVRCTRPATEADHIMPHKGDWNLFMLRSNLQGLCAHCHSVKTAREDGGFGREVNNV